MRPNWTVLYWLQFGEWRSLGKEFFTKEEDAIKRFNELHEADEALSEPIYVPTKRPYDNDRDKYSLVMG